MKRNAIFVLVTCLIAGFGFTQDLEAQSRKKLKEEIAKLQQEIVRLTQELTTAEAQVNQLQSENQRYAEQNAALSSQVTQLQQDNLALNQQYQTVLKDYQALQAGGGGTMPGTVTPGTGTMPPTSGGTGTLPPAGDGLKCAYYQDKLTPNTTYTEYFNVLQSNGYGVQVFSTKSLCQAAEYAEKFKKDFSMYKTYIRCKQVGNSQMYAVVYGSLRDKSQAQTYRNNLKKKYPRQFNGSFVVQH